MSASRVSKHVRRYHYEVADSWSFFDYFANAVQVDAQQRQAAYDELEAYLRATYSLDPVGVTAVRNVMRGGRDAKP